jgi:hypothetical protein
MSETLSPAARTRLASISKQLKAKFPKSDSRLAAATYAIYVCQAARQTGENVPRLMSAAQVVLPPYLNGIPVPDYFLGEDADAVIDQQPLAYRAARLIDDVAKLNAASLDLSPEVKLAEKWSAAVADKLPFQLLLLDRIANPSELIEIHPNLPTHVFGLLLRSEEGDSDQPSANAPACLAELVAKAFTLGKEQAALDLTFGLGGITAAAMAENNEAKFFAQEADPLQAFLGWLRVQIMPGAESAVVRIGDPLTHAFAKESEKLPVSLTYVYHMEPSPKGELLRFMSQESEAEDRLRTIRDASQKRLSQCEEEAHMAEREFDVAKQRLSDESKAARQPAEREAILKLLEVRLRQAANALEVKKAYRARAQSEFFEAERQYRQARLGFRAEGLSLHRNDGRDLKLIRHALETVTPTGSVVAIVSGRNLLRPQSVRALRAYLTADQNWLDAVVELPRGIAGAGERVAMLVFRKGRAAKDVLFVDASRIDAVVKAGSEDEALDIVAPDSPLLRRQRVEDLPEAYVARLVEIIRDRVEYDGVSAKVELALAPGESVDLRPQQHLRSVGSVRVTVEKLFQKLEASVEQTRKAAAALQASRASLGLAPLNPQSGTAAPRPSGN